MDTAESRLENEIAYKVTLRAKYEQLKAENKAQKGEIAHLKGSLSETELGLEEALASIKAQHSKTAARLDEAEETIADLTRDGQEVFLHRHTDCRIVGPLGRPELKRTTYLLPDGAKSAQWFTDAFQFYRDEWLDKLNHSTHGSVGYSYTPPGIGACSPVCSVPKRALATMGANAAFA
jgi:hypothetical protein